MKCSNCSHENPEMALFCMKCGTKLQRVCPKCDAQLPPDALFCMRCGTKLAEPTAAVTQIPHLEDVTDQLYIPAPLAERMQAAAEDIQGENRLVTALFADISGFTGLSNQHASEHVVKVVNDCFRVIVDAVLRYEGSINRFIGDNVLAFFGAPILHENDPERAILAALEMHDKVRELSLQVAIGINTGVMYFGPIGTIEHMEVSAYGPDINLAKRLQEAAQPQQILIGASTYRLTHRAFEFKRVPGLPLKGIEGKVMAYEALRQKVHPEKLRGVEGLRSRMIGREREFADLQEAMQAWREGRGQLVTIIGEAGIGKSRLVTELKGYLRGLEEREDGKDGSWERQSAIVLEGRCISIGQPISYWPFLDILRTWCELTEEDTDTVVARKVRDKVDAVAPDQSADILPFLGRLMHLSFGGELETQLDQYSPEQIRHQTMMRLRDLILAMTARQPLMLVLEDLHWADDLSLDMISLLMDELMRVPLMLVCVYRPEREHRCWQLSSMAQRKCLERYTEISLQKLSPHESRVLVQELLAIDNLPESVRETILAKSEGNPFFIEEVIRSLIEQGLVYREGERWTAKAEVVEVQVPDTIQSVILSRVDRLESEARYVLQCASVIGRLFKYRLLEHLTRQQRQLDRYISQFEERELVYEERSVPELEYAFKHVLTQEATYQSILEQRRRDFHRQVAEGIERLYRERLEDFYEELAHHWEQSGDAAKTLEYLVKSGEKADAQCANRSAIKYYTQAIELARSRSMLHQEAIIDLILARGQVYRRTAEYNLAVQGYEEGLAHVTSPIQRAKLHAQIADVYRWLMDNITRAAHYTALAVKELESAPDTREKAEIFYACSGNYTGNQVTVAYLDEAKRIALSLDEPALLGKIYLWEEFICGALGMQERRRQAALQAIRYFPALKEEEGKNPLIYSLYARILDDPEESKRTWATAVEVGERYGHNPNLSYSTWFLGERHESDGEIEQAIQVYRKGWEVSLQYHLLNPSPKGSSTYNLGKHLLEIHHSRREYGPILRLFDELLDATANLLVQIRESSSQSSMALLWNRWHEMAFDPLEKEFRSISREFSQQLDTRWQEALATPHTSEQSVVAHLRQMRKSLEQEDLPQAQEHAAWLLGRVEVDLPAERWLPVQEALLTYVLTGHLEKASRLLEQLLTWDFQLALRTLTYPFVAPELVSFIDWPQFEDGLLTYIQEQGLTTWLFYGLWSSVQRLYRQLAREAALRHFTRRLEGEIRDWLREEGVSQLLMEPASLPWLGDRVCDTLTADALSQGEWKWLDPGRDCQLEWLPTGAVEIHVPLNHNLWPGNLNAPRLLRPESGDFILETAVCSREEGKRHGGLLVWVDDDNFLRFELPSGGNLEGSVYMGGSIGGNFVHPGVHAWDEDLAYLRLERCGDRFTGYVSVDGEQWFRCGWVDLPMTGPIQVGIHALCSNGPPTSTRFSYFRAYRT